MSGENPSLLRLRQIEKLNNANIDSFIEDGAIPENKLTEAIQLLLSYIDTEGSIMDAINRAKSELPINLLRFDCSIVDTSIVNILNFNHEKVVGKLPLSTLQLGFIVSRNGAIQEEGKDFTADYENDQLTFIANNLTPEETITLRCLYYDEPVISKYITFADPEVERICIENWSSDGIGLTYEDAAAVTTLNQVFMQNESITSFDELQFFTSLQTIADYEFAACLNLLSINIPPSVTSIGEKAFVSCQNLLSINIPNSVNSIDEGAFWDCKKLKSVILPNGITQLSKNVFYACLELDSIIIPNSVTSIDDDAFNACYLLPIIIPNSVKTIGIASFWNCGTPVSITIPNSVTHIGERAFQYCFSLQSLYMQSINPPIIGNQCFPTEIALSTIYVPAESVNAYKEAEGWSTYAELITAIIE